PCVPQRLDWQRGAESNWRAVLPGRLPPSSVKYPSIRQIDGQGLKRVELESERTGRRLQLAQFQHSERITDVAHERQPAAFWDNLGQGFESFASKSGRQC